MASETYKLDSGGASAPAIFGPHGARQHRGSPARSASGPSPADAVYVGDAAPSAESRRLKGEGFNPPSVGQSGAQAAGPEPRQLASADRGAPPLPRRPRSSVALSSPALPWHPSRRPR